LESATCSIGRDEKNLIVLNSPKISRYHATLLRITTPGADSHQFRIIDGDLNGRRSRNGIEVNGNRCFSYDLQDGDVISFCEGIIAKYYAVNTPTSSQPLNSSFDGEDDDDPNATRFFGNSNNSHQITTRKTMEISEEERQASIQQSLERLASFPELLFRSNYRNRYKRQYYLFKSCCS
jgi:pSer/pThr/pTyr-binding forkhead associated (FHA) protein